ncbi:MAG: D-aminoacyl-tRNA deacylase [Candidatus Heimdallarchaeota archaeon]|nr:D-aminoacyl-tRNA deacylase [Candidatus Heimdallarchaeota archaeon]MCK4770565.1 D-aminoacyl-tRNA deacylase [Candidatus Heimdallarchaeota archaeon]
MSIKTKVAIVVPKKDLAATTIWKMLDDMSYFRESGELFDNNPVFEFERAPNDIKLIHSNKDGVESNHLDDYINAELYIFASRHRAASGTPALLIHPTGNWSKITLGGREKQLAYTSGWVLKKGLTLLQEKRDKYNLEGFKVDLEVTHHGPTELKTPLIFMELGSSEEFWKNEEAASAVGEAIIDTAKAFTKESSFAGEYFVGLGGNHYAYRFHKHVTENEHAFISHMAAKHTLDDLTKEMLLQAFEKTVEDTKAALIDKKGARSEQRKHAISLLESIDKEYVLV